MTKQQTKAMLTDSGGAALQMIAHKKLQAQIKNVLEDYELNLTQWLIISQLDEVEKGMRTTDLARMMHVEVPLVTMMSRPLRSRGLITTDSQTPDRREKLLRATAQAKKIVGAVESRVEGQLANMVQGVTPRDIQSYFKVLQNIVASPSPA